MNPGFRNVSEKGQNAFWRAGEVDFEAAAEGPFLKGESTGKREVLETGEASEKIRTGAVTAQGREELCRGGIKVDDT